MVSFAGKLSKLNKMHEFKSRPASVEISFSYYVYETPRHDVPELKFYGIMTGL